MGLDDIHRDIDACRVCHEVHPRLKKPTAMFRGVPGQVMVIGEGPGNKEVASGQAFSGPAGRRLMHWLESCGISDPRGSLYFTSAAKCYSPEKSIVKVMSYACQNFLRRQICEITPRMIITVGGLSFEHIRVNNEEYAERLCTIYNTSDHVMFTNYGYHFWHVTWPHPSPLNRQLNDESIKQALQRSFNEVKNVLESAEILQRGI